MAIVLKPATLDTAELAKMLGVSERHIANMDVQELLPAPVRLGRLKRWTVANVEAWLAAGCPDRKTFDSAKTQQAA
ncbi:MAG: hypothetical protein CL946_03925 [Ectothiorhodospiraceae bacterium]|nr:hypothetical protein [Ectothiorhodospiraceae bacterium]